MSLAMTIAPETQTNPKAERPKATKRTSRPAEAKPRKLSIYLSEDAVRRLDVHVAMDGGDRSRLVELLIAENLRRYDMPRRRSGPTLLASEDRQDTAVA